ncbi:DUF262 domain-containing protein [Spirulina sp. CCNP1310]|uniref:DUF262 domain-containing protein n=1 Tax=Spirulina sp. CCNP1310 TaxID=3110249 RepID=UPI002B1F7E91|nr:DUF262 domain-containing protein [Spirulina sp. CCNP1310]MEA5418500.1 DUF262 domain-containing protein [Spirulina sp. CCNP1310]
MNNQINVKPDTTFLNDLLNDIAKGKYKIPVFQREFIWKSSQMIELFDSILKGYPIGSLLFWKTQGYKTKNTIGPYLIDQKSSEINYVLDGFQRISTLFGVLMNPRDFSTDPESDYKKFVIYFDLENTTFSSVKTKKDNDLLIIPLSKIYDNRQLFDVLRQLDKEKDIPETQKNMYIENARNLQSILTHYRIPYVEIQGGDIRSAVEIFSRTNSTGTEISEDFMLSALTYNADTGFLLSDSITEFLNEINIYNFENIKRGVILNCISNTYGMVHLNKKNYFDVPIEALRNNDFNLGSFSQDVYIHVQKSINFLYKKLFVIDAQLLPYPSQLIFISEYFRVNPNPTPEQYASLKNWFWITTYSNYFTLYSLSQQRTAYQIFCEFAAGKHHDGIYRVNENEFTTAKYPDKLTYQGVRQKALKLFYLKSIMDGYEVQEKESIKEIFVAFKKDKAPANIILRLSSEFEEKPKNKKVENFIKSTDIKILQKHFITEEMVELYQNGRIDDFLEKRGEHLKRKEQEFVQNLEIRFE